MGVRRAMDIALEALLKKEGPIYTYGPLIHNPQILELLEEKGVKILNAEEGLSACLPAGEPARQTMIIRAHGVAPQERQAIKDAGMRTLDATCPHVGKVQGIIKRYANEGYAIIIVGEKDHAEVMGLLGYAGGRGQVVNTREEVEDLAPMGRVCCVAQTTQDRLHFQTIVGALQKRFPGVKVFNTICSSTHQRQEEVLALARRVEAMVVVGGKGSGNTRRLVKISEGTGIPTFHAETEKELDLAKLSQYSVIGVTAGASTPNWLILKVVERLRNISAPRGLAHYGEEFFRFLVTTYTFLALGAGCLTYASFSIQGLRPNLPSALIAGLYVFSMHVLNRFMDREGEKYKQPWRTEFYERHGLSMIIAGICSAVLLLILGWFQGPLSFFLLLAISGLGTSYNLPILPRSLV
ncbi:MAG: 4-hydroxy-3-methylbut-2-enyl diphosphate reductase, partial [Deltaproteobacteria bacterium]|nr:4-hydroxy-3-methylbut-2-enyl diphosphate reductase [Deltaproteobacteria bacterium]